MPQKKSNSRFFKVFFSLTLLLVFNFTTVRANDVEQAETYVQNLSNKIILIIEDDTAVEKKQNQLLRLFKENASILTISRAALGSKWRNLTDRDKKRFTDAFTKYLVQKYGRQFEEFKGAKLTTERSIDAGRRGVLVHTRLIMPATSPISVKWQVWQKNGTFKLIDIIIEDISMLTMEREEIKNRLTIHNGDINVLITDLKNK